MVTFTPTPTIKKKIKIIKNYNINHINSKLKKKVKVNHVKIREQWISIFNENIKY